LQRALNQKILLVKKVETSWRRKSGMILMSTNTEGKLVLNPDAEGVANGETIK
jgi:hypothetical protein